MRVEPNARSLVNDHWALRPVSMSTSWGPSFVPGSKESDPAIVQNMIVLETKVFYAKNIQGRHKAMAWLWYLRGIDSQHFGNERE